VPLRIALFGQAAFGRDVLMRLLEAGHEVAGVYTPPEGKRADPLADEATTRGLPLFRQGRFRRKQDGEWVAIPEVLEAYRALEADLNVLAYVTAILPEALVEAPPRGSLCFHPSLLPRFRGGAALAWQIILGESESGVTVFRPDAGVDSGPIVVQRGGVPITGTDTAGSLYFERLYPLGVEALVEAVDAVASGSASYEPQDESRATFQGLVDDEVARIDWSRDAVDVDRLIRGCDPQPGAVAMRGKDEVRLFGGRLLEGEREGASDAPPGTVLGLEDERLVLAAQGGRIAVERVRLAGGPKTAAPEAGLVVGDVLG
jgi:methionyl-tRNA formyltransferase